MIFYGIKYNGNLLGLSVSPNHPDEDFCNSYVATLVVEDSPWLTPYEDIAKMVISGKVPWYNSSMDQPQFSPSVYPGATVVAVQVYF